MIIQIAPSMPGAIFVGESALCCESAPAWPASALKHELDGRASGCVSSSFPLTFRSFCQVSFYPRGEIVQYSNI